MSFKEYLFAIVAIISAIIAIKKSKPETIVEYVEVKTQCVCEKFEDAMLSKAIEERNLDGLCVIWADNNEYTYVDDLPDVCSDNYSEQQTYDRDW